ncbi:hypothetical protein BRAS3843_230037 [Bradyrhizobium sp. STM 3843]|nr:hypothetical protein BRAS3843_230037 [Bradyrhizobium sp. STM 3843]
MDGQDVSARGQPTRARPISAYLVMLALVTSLPITAAAAFLAYHFVSESSQLLRTEYEDRLRLMRNATELRIANVIEDLQVLALSPLLQQGRLTEFRAHAVEVVSLIGGTAIVLYAPDGQQLVNTRLPPDQPLPRRVSFEAERRAMETGLPQVSGLQKAVVDGQPIVTIAVPVRVDGQIRYALNIGLSTNYLSALMDDYVSPGMVGSIIDQKGLLLARRPLLDGEDLIGKPTIPEVLARLGEASAFWIKAMSRKGVPTYTSLLRSPQSGWTINLAIPREVVEGPLHRTVEWILVLAALAFLLSLWLARQFSAKFLTALEGLERYVMELRRHVSEPITGSVEEVNRMQNVLHQVGRELAGAEKIIERERSLLRATVESLPIGVLLVAPDGTVTLINNQMLRLWGIDGLTSVDDPEPLGRPVDKGRDTAELAVSIVRALRDGVATETEEVVHRVDGTERNLVITAVPVRDDEGETLAAVCGCYDVTALRSALQQQRGLLDEINHRVKNTLSTVQSIARLSRASAHSLEGFASSFEERILALSEAYNLLTANNWVGASLQDIVRRTLAPYAGPERLSISGPSILLPPKLALALSAALQELSTNAAKYGALSIPSGKVDVIWSRAKSGTICLSWTESDGPAVSKPTRQGFGTRMIQTIFATEPAWTVKLDFEPAGLRCTMRFSASDPTSDASSRVMLTT